MGHDLFGDGDYLDAGILRSGHERMHGPLRRWNVQKGFDRTELKGLSGRLGPLGQEAPVLFSEGPLLESRRGGDVSIRGAGDDDLAGWSPSASATHGRGRLGAEPCPSDLDEPGKARGVRRGDVGEYFSVEIDVCGLQAPDEQGVRHPVHASRRANTDDPQPSKLPLAPAPVPVGVYAGVKELLLRNAVSPGPGAVVPLGLLKNCPAPLATVDAP